MSTNISRTHSRSSSATRPSLLPSALPRDPSPQLDPKAQSSDPPRLLQETSLGSEEQHEEFNPLEPFFVHVDDVHSAATYHPRVQYIFSDDDGGVLTDKLLQIEAEISAEASGSRPGSRPQASSKRSGTAAGKHQAGERVVVVQMGANGRSVESAYSLSGEWQVLGAEVSSAPTLEGEGEDGGLMLRIRGTGGIEDGAREGAKDSATSEASLESVVADYRERMEELKKILESGIH